MWERRRREVTSIESSTGYARKVKSVVENLGDNAVCPNENMVCCQKDNRILNHCSEFKDVGFR